MRDFFGRGGDKGRAQKYTIATPFLYDETPPGAWDFTLIDPVSGSQAVAVPAPCDGNVIEASHNDRAGNFTWLECFNGPKWFMAHYQSLDVSTNSYVEEGDALGIQGSTGNSSGPHVHAVIVPENGSQSDRTLTKPILDRYFDLLQSFPSHDIAASPQVAAFLDTIAWAEGADYDTLVGGGSFHSFDDHPREKIWIDTIDNYSTAAGRYQFIVADDLANSTWDQYANKLGLKDFSPDSQDKAAIAILEENNVPSLLSSGQTEQAFCEVGGVWASLPCNGYGQPQKSPTELVRHYYKQLNTVE